MIRYTSQNQPTLPGFDTPPEMVLDPNNRWVRLSDCIPWDNLAQSYHKTLSATTGRPCKDARIVIGAIIIKHKLAVSDEETVEQIRENPYLQYFIGLKGFQSKAPFAPSLLVEVRKRMGQGVFDEFHEAVIESVERKKAKRAVKDSDNDGTNGTPSSNDAESDNGEADLPQNHGKLILDATVAEQAIRYPTDLGLLNEARELSERIIDILFTNSPKPRTKKPRTYRKNARKAYLGIVKQKRPANKNRRVAIRQQLQYLRRNLEHIEVMLTAYPYGEPLPLPNWLIRRYWVLPHLYDQQYEMYKANAKRCNDRIVSISQPHLRPIVRGKLGKSVEFGAKISVSLTGDKLAHVDKLHWDACHEGHDLQSQVEAYKNRYGYYPEAVIADRLYGSRNNRSYLEKYNIRFSGKPLGRPPKATTENQSELKRLKAQRRLDYRERIPIEGKFGQGKYGYRLNNIRARRADTSIAWINAIFLVMNLLVLMQVFLRFKKFTFKTRFQAANFSILGKIEPACCRQSIAKRNYYLPEQVTLMNF
jgi:hypothetical protein